jgi:Leucine-rich repeat (LRR) protein
LGCAYSVTNGWLLRALYTCNATVFSFNNNRNVRNVTQNHLPGRNNRHVTQLNIRDQNIGFIPRGIGRFCHNLESLTMVSTGITEISFLDLQHLPALRELNLYQNQIQTLRANFLMHNPRIHFVSFSYNPIRNIAASVFDLRYDLVSLNFVETTCINAFTNNRVGVINLVTRLNIECPPPA